jgi:hypothetical protein
LSETSEAMSGTELSDSLKPEIVRLIQMALYYDFVLYNMQQKPFYGLLSVHGGAIKNIDRSTITTEHYRIDQNTIHAALVKCLKSKSQCDTADLGMQVKAIKEMYDDKINGFKAVTKTTPAKLYDLLNPGDGDINVAIQKAAREIMAYSPSQKRLLYIGDDDEVFQLIFKNAAVEFLDDETVEAIRSIMEPEIALPRRMGGRRTRRRGTRRHGPKRHNRRSYKTKKRTRRH